MKKRKKNIWMLLTLVLIVSFWGMKAEAASNFIYDIDNIHDGTVSAAYEAKIYYYGYEDQIQSAAVSAGTLPDGLTCSVDKGFNSVKISGTPTKAGTFTFRITAISENKAAVTSKDYTVTICTSWTTFSLSLTDCSAKHDSGTVDTYFRAGEKVTLIPKDLMKTEYVYSWKNNAGLAIRTGNITEKLLGEVNTFFMPAKNVSVECLRESKDLGMLNHEAVPSKGADETCGRIAIKSMDLALELGIVKNIGYIKEGHKADTTNQRILYYYNIDLDKDGTVDLEMMDNWGSRYGSGSGGEVCYMRIADGRSVYGTWTVEIPKTAIYSTSAYGLYSKIVFNMGNKSSGSSGSSGSWTPRGWWPAW